MNKNVIKSFIHIGVDKCGSSSLQQFLSNNIELKSFSNRSLDYYCITNNGILKTKELKRISKELSDGYISSLGLSKIKEFNNDQFNALKLENSKNKNDLIYSCEGWYRALKDKELFLKLCNSLEGNINRELNFIAYIRSPVMWINSAWWQWGAWQNNNNYEFEKWLENSILNVRWSRYFSKFKSEYKKYKFIIKPLKEDIILDFLKILDIQNKVQLNQNINKGLPIEILKFYISNPKFKVIHENKYDHLLLNIMKNNNIKFRKTPWILNKDSIRIILNKTKESNKKILEILNENDRKYLLNDPSWWHLEYFENHETYSPFLEEYSLKKDLEYLFLNGINKYT